MCGSSNFGVHLKYCTGEYTTLAVYFFKKNTYFFSETDEFITASENEVEDEDSEEDEFAKQIREPEEIEWGRHGKWGRSKWIREQMGQQVNEEEDEDSEEDELWNTDDMMRIQIGDGDAEYWRELRQLSSREKQTDSAETIAKRRLYAYQQEQRVRAIVGRY